MNKWCFLLMAACLLAPDTGHAALKARDDVKAEDAFNPNPAPDDLILPMPCGQSMVLKAVGVRGKGLLWDLETRFGRRERHDAARRHLRQQRGLPGSDA